MSSAPLDLSVIVVAYNSPDLLRATLASVVQHTRAVSYELIVVDNASPNNRVDLVTQEFAAVRLVRNPRNLGFAAANNLGMRLSAGRYIALLNPDTLLHNDALSTLARWLDQHPHVGAVGPQLLQSNGRPQPYSYGDAPSPRYLLRRRLGRLARRDLHDWQGTQPQLADWVAATCVVVRRVALEAAGLLDERFFLYFEDVDWGMRLTRAGWPVMFVPSVAIAHIGGGSVGAGSRPHYDRSLTRLYAKHYGAGAALVVGLALRLYRALQSIAGVRRDG